MDVLIEAQELRKVFGELVAVEGINLKVSEGEIYGLVGPDGAGKTTTMRLLCGALKPTSGQAWIGGCSVGEEVEAARAQIGYLPQRFSLYEEMTVMENLRFFAEVRGLSAGDWQPRCMDILEFVGLADFTERRAGQLSGGMKQKLGLAASLVHRPRVLLLDEPTTGVDPVTRQDFWQLIIRLTAEEGVALLVSTPYMDEAARCVRLGFMHQGRVLVEGTPGMLRSMLTERVVELQGEPLPALRRVAEADEDVQVATMFGDRLHLLVSEGSAGQVIQRLESKGTAAGYRVTLIRAIPPQLEDVFIALRESGA